MSSVPGGGYARLYYLDPRFIEQHLETAGTQLQTHPSRRSILTVELEVVLLGSRRLATVGARHGYEQRISTHSMHLELVLVGVLTESRLFRR